MIFTSVTAAKRLRIAKKGMVGMGATTNPTTSLKNKVISEVNTVKTVWHNFLELLDAICLTAVSSYAIYESVRHATQLWYKALMVAGLMIALQAFVLLLRHLNKNVA